MGLCNRGEGVSGSWTDPICAVKTFGVFMALPEELGKGTGRGKDGKMELPEFSSSPVF